MQTIDCTDSSAQPGLRFDRQALIPFVPKKAAPDHFCDLVHSSSGRYSDPPQLAHSQVENCPLCKPLRGILTEKIREVRKIEGSDFD